MKKILSTTCGLGLLALASACGQPDEQCPAEVCGAVDEADPVDARTAMLVEGDLGSFTSNPRAFMFRLPAKELPAGLEQIKYFDDDTVRSNGFIDAKHAKGAVDDMGNPLKLGSVRENPDAKTDAWASNDWAKNLVDNGATMVTKLSEMGSRRLKSAKLAESPWSDHYWALYEGSLANRYADPMRVTGTDWKANTDYTRNKQPANVDHLSPAEKYDLLIGARPSDPGSMTSYNINTGKPYYDSARKVETWMGICHGWAPAAYMVARPQKVITVKAADGMTNINFYPSDIKALGSLLWANARSDTKFIGGRCNTKMPQTDEIGRIKDQACRDTNAGSWHLSVVNQIGISKRSFVLDATFDYEVWNQPVYGYSYTYFNPKTNRTSSTLSGATVARSSFPEDKFAKYRAPNSTHIVGIAMTVQYVVETKPSHAPTDSAARDAITSARYLYTLELDSQGNIVGGEWLQNLHPDFLWTPPKGAKALSYFDGSATGAWDGKSALPMSWQSAARSAARYGQPLAAIVNKLAEVTRQ